MSTLGSGADDVIMEKRMYAKEEILGVPATPDAQDGRSEFIICSLSLARFDILLVF